MHWTILQCKMYWTILQCKMYWTILRCKMLTTEVVSNGHTLLSLVNSLPTKTVFFNTHQRVQSPLWRAYPPGWRLEQAVRILHCPPGHWRRRRSTESQGRPPSYLHILATRRSCSNTVRSIVGCSLHLFHLLHHHHHHLGACKNKLDYTQIRWNILVT